MRRLALDSMRPVLFTARRRAPSARLALGWALDCHHQYFSSTLDAPLQHCWQALTELQQLMSARDINGKGRSTGPLASAIYDNSFLPLGLCLGLLQHAQQRDDVGGKTEESGMGGPRTRLAT